MNLSQKKRQRMLEMLARIREEHRGDDETLSAINEIENELNAKKYGLVWEEHEEAVNVHMRTHIPVFSEDTDKEITSSEGGYNFLLEGDNLHSLYLLEKTHRGRIDVIYIDPPYNTKNKDFVYDDCKIGEDDGFRHSKWISFMNERLQVAKNLLSDNGVIFISIDDNEQANLKLLCDEIFGENNFTAVFPRLATKSGKTPVAYMISHDYVLCYTNGKSDVFIGEAFEDASYKYADEFVETRGKYNLKQPLDCNSISYSASLDYPIVYDAITYYPGSNYENYKRRKEGIHLPKDYAWRWSKSLYEFGLANGWIVFQNGRIYTKGYLNAIIEKNKETGEYFISYREKSRKISTIDFVSNEYSNDIAKKQLKNCQIKVNFDYPKPIELIKKLISTYYSKNATVLDFFAGSGTTGQAVLELNRQDGGNRHFILCTNNENNICTDVTYPRIKTVISGKRQDGSVYSDGIPANLKYYRTDFVARDCEYLSDELLEHVAEMIQLENGVKIDGSQYIMLLDEQDTDEMAENWENYSDVKTVYVAQDVLFTTEQAKIFADVDIKTIPDYYFEFDLRQEGESW